MCLLNTGLSGSLASQVASALELKIENQDKDEMHDNHSSDGIKSDDESDKRDIKTPRGGTRTRYVRPTSLLCALQIEFP